MRWDGEEWLTPAEVARALRVSPHTVRVWLRRGWLKGLKLPAKAGWRIHRRELERWTSQGVSESCGAPEKS